MSFTRSTENVAVHQTLSDYPNSEDGLTAEQLKELFDSPATQLQNDLNNLETELENSTSAASLGAAVLDNNDVSSANVQAKLIKIYSELKSIFNGGVADESVVAAKLANNSVTTDKIANLNVTTEKIKEANVTANKLANNSVTTAKISDKAVTLAKLEDAAKRAINITATALNESDVSDANVQAKLNKLANEITEISQDGVADNSITEAKIVNYAVTTNKIKNLNVTTPKINDSAVTETKIANNAVTSNKIASNAVTSDKIANGYGIVPSGFIGMWSGSITTIPTGWLLCNGQNGTPDLRNKFIVGSGDEYSVGDTGGEKEHILTIDEMPSHNHSFTKYGTESNGGSYVVSATDSGIRGTQNTANKGGGEAHENRPPYYALAFIMKA